MTTGATTELTVRYFAGARAAAGTEAEVLSVPAGATVDDVLAELGRRHGPGLEKVLAACSFLLDEVAVRARDHTLPARSTLDVLPPFAGG
ncbi:MAG TPA: MoaD/ThiS family protein [Pseudonocardiaceae bacterium]